MIVSTVLTRFIAGSDADDLQTLRKLREILLGTDDRGRIAADAPWGGADAVRVVGRLVECDIVTPTANDPDAGGPESDAAPVADITSSSLRFSDRVLEDASGQGGFAAQRLRWVQLIDDRVQQLNGERYRDDADTRMSLVTAASPPDTSSREAPHLDGAAPTIAAGTLSARGLVKVYKKRRVVNEVDIFLSQGEIVGLLGPNGAGKTTTFYMVVGLIKPDRGRVFFGDENVTGVPMYRRARRGIGYLSQEPSIFRKLSVEENILAVLQMMRLPRRQQRERLETLLDELGIKHLRHAKAYALSGGERRRLEITRALVGNPKFMLLDEPFAGVDPIAVHDIQQIVADLRRRGIGVLISDHNVEQTLDIVDRAYIMYEGRVRVSGTVAELVWNDEAAEIYLGPTLTARMRQRYPQPQ
jgi:lipopolysaccharide export system ATP-binding protein